MLLAIFSLCVWYCLGPGHCDSALLMSQALVLNTKKVTNEVSLRINSFQAWFNNSLEWWFPGETTIQSELTDIFGLTYIMSLPISPAAGAVVDFFAGRYRPSGQGLRFYLSRVA